MPTAPDAMAIAEVPSADTDEVVSFVMAARAVMFPMLDAAQVPADLADFQRTYGAGDGARFLVARHAGLLAGAIGYLPYDGRFSQLDYARQPVVEVVRLFIDPAFRRRGVAAQLFAALKAKALLDGVQVLYLHTHPFLPGAIAFWQREGFSVVDVEDDPLWQTTHMQYLITAADGLSR